MKQEIVTTTSDNKAGRNSKSAGAPEQTPLENHSGSVGSVDNPSIEEEVSEESRIIAAVKLSIEEGNQTVITEGTRFTVGQFFPENDKPPYADVIMPPGYTITSIGVLEISTVDEVKYLTRTPVFLSARTDGKLLVVWKSGNLWLKDWLKPNQLKASTLENMMIFPDNDATPEDIDAYIKSFRDYLQYEDEFGDVYEVINEVSEKFLAGNITFPKRVPIPDIKKLCQDYGAKYSDVRKWLWQRGYVEEKSEVQRVQVAQAQPTQAQAARGQVRGRTQRTPVAQVEAGPQTVRNLVFLKPIRQET